MLSSIEEILILENDLGYTGTVIDPVDEYDYSRIQINEDYEYHILLDGIRIVGTHNDSHEDNYTAYPESPESAVRLMSALVNRFHSLDYCHCSRPIYFRYDDIYGTGGEPFTRGLCKDCDMVRCDAYPEDCPFS